MELERAEIKNMEECQHFDTEDMKLESSSNNKGGNKLLKNSTKNKIFLREKIIRRNSGED